MKKKKEKKPRLKQIILPFPDLLPNYPDEVKSPASDDIKYQQLSPFWADIEEHLYYNFNKKDSNVQ